MAYVSTEANSRLFADDSSLFYAAANIADIAGIINHDLQLLSNWAKQWLVTFNPLKTEAVLFTLKKLDILPHLIFDNIAISFVDSHRHLGVTLSSNGQWHTHIENIVNSATKILGIMRKLKYSISRNALNQMYMSYMLPVVEYASVVWDGCSEQDSQTLQKIQNEAARIVTGLTSKSKERCKDQELIQSSTTPDPGYQWESDKLTEDTPNRAKRSALSQQATTKHTQTDAHKDIANTRQNKNIKDPQKKYRLGTVSKIFYWRA